MKKLIFILSLIWVQMVTGICTAQDIRVGLVVGQTTAELLAEDPFFVHSGDAKVEMAPGKYFVHEQEGRLVFDDQHSFDAAVTVSVAEHASLPLVNKRGGYGVYRIYAQSRQLLVVDELDVEQYLTCVLPAKTMPIWPDEVLKAQTIAARSYAYHAIEQPAHSLYDLRSIDEELRYYDVGKRVEKKDITRIIFETRGTYLVDDEGRAIYAVSTDSSGGQTEALEKYPYLVNVKDYDQDSPDSTWEKRLSPFIVQNLLEQRGFTVGKLETVCLSPENAPGPDRSDTGRVVYMVFIGAQGSAKVGAKELKELLDLPSNLFDVKTGVPMPDTLKVNIENGYGMVVGSKDIAINLKDREGAVWKNLVRSYHIVGNSKEEKITFFGRGKGLGYGLSAWGARGYYNLAPESTSYGDILRYYYPGTELKERS